MEKPKITWSRRASIQFENAQAFIASYDEFAADDFIDKLIESEELKRALTVLSQTEKERLLEYHIIGKTLSQIGEEQGCSAAAVKYSVDRAIKKLKKFYNLT